MGFDVYELDVVGGVLALSPMPTCLAVVTNWRADVVLTMTEPHEMPATVSAELAASGIVWLQFPVVDYGVPDHAADWAGIEAAVLAALAQGKRVLIHCKGGCGRSGMAVLRIMIAAGEASEAALARLRQVRPCAVETEAQMLWATA